jgi:gas vesicle protein
MAHVVDDKPVIIIEKSSGGGLGGFLLGALVGAGAALLFAPQTGEETREVLRERGKRLRDDAQARVSDLGQRLEDGYERAKEHVEDGFDTARQTFDEKRAGAKDALDAGRAAVHSARDELDKRLAEERSGGEDVDDVDEEDED